MAIVRPQHPGRVTVRASALPAWHQIVTLPLFSPELPEHMARKGSAERVRIGTGRQFSIDATAEHSTSSMQLWYAPGSSLPELIEHDERYALSPEEAAELGLI